ncbi:MAG: TolC family protein, partial [Deltaproteobacteria bacterium]|nr:TolC family protein [Deltaproteobacteria bacterium]
LNVAWREWQVAQAARQHVYRLILLKKQISVAKEGEKGLQKNRDAVKQAVDMGDMTTIDLSAAEAALQAVHLTVLVTEQQMEKERLALNQSLGFGPERAVPLETEVSLPKVENPPSLTTIMNGLEDRRLDLLALKMGYESQDDRVRAAVLAQFPKVNIGFLQARDNSNVGSTGFAVSIDLPFFDRNQGQIAIQRATRKQLFDEYVDRLFEARSNVATILADMVSIKKQIGATERALPTLKDVVDRYRQALLEGIADVLSYYNVVNELIAKRLELLRLKQNLMDQNIALEITSGRYLGGEEAKGVRN